jgi:hypothetical protein
VPQREIPQSLVLLHQTRTLNRSRSALLRRHNPIKLSDHISISENHYFSLAGAGLIEEHNSGFLSVKEGKGT